MKTTLAKESKTTLVKNSDIQHGWGLVDASDKVLGRLAV